MQWIDLKCWSSNELLMMVILLIICIFQCKCWPGFRLKGDGKTCIDIDECATSFPCSQQCINTYGTYRCLCAEGYEIRADNPNSCKVLSGMIFYLFPSALKSVEIHNRCTIGNMISRNKPFLKPQWTKLQSIRLIVCALTFCWYNFKKWTKKLSIGRLISSTNVAPCTSNQEIYFFNSIL